MRPGKVSQTVWRRSVFKQLHMEKPASGLRISEAEMCTALPVNGNEDAVFVTAGATVCGNTKYAGYYAAVKALNDLASRGGLAQTVQMQVTLPVSAEESDLKALVGETKTLCAAQQISIAGVQTEVSPAVRETIVSVTAMGIADRASLLHIENAAAGQDIILCGSIALEGMERILDECEEELKERFVPTFLRQMKEKREELLQTRAIQAAWGHVSAMQQIGSGGIFAALWELAEASGIGLQVDLQKMTVCQETIELCEIYRLNPYQMTSAGGILMLTDEGDHLIDILRGCGARAGRLGIATAENARVITSGGEKRFLDRPAADELALWKERKLQSNQ